MRRGHRVRFPIVLVAVGVLAVGCGGDDDDDAQLANPASAYCVEQGGRVEIEDEPGGQVGYCELPDGSRVEEWELYRRSSTTTATAPCSGDPDAALASDPSLPAVVEAMRQDLAAAASTCDYAALQELVDRNGDGVRSTFGEQGDAVAAWRDEEETGEVEPMRALQLLLGLPAARTEGPDGSTLVWPAAFATTRVTTPSGRWPTPGCTRWTSSRRGSTAGPTTWAIGSSSPTTATGRSSSTATEREETTWLIDALQALAS